MLEIPILPLNFPETWLNFPTAKNVEWAIASALFATSTVPAHPPTVPKSLISAVNAASRKTCRNKPN